MYLTFGCMSIYAWKTGTANEYLASKSLPDAIKLIELGYWPVTPARPTFASQYLMDWIEALLLECQVAICAGFFKCCRNDSEGKFC